MNYCSTSIVHFVHQMYKFVHQVSIVFHEYKIKNNFDYIYRPRDHDIPTNSDSGNGNSEMVATVSRSKSNVQGERADNL